MGKTYIAEGSWASVELLTVSAAGEALAAGLALAAGAPGTARAPTAKATITKKVLENIFNDWRGLKLRVC